MPAPVQQPEAVESAPITQEGRYGVEDAIATITQEAVAQTLAENAPTPETPTRNEKGQFVKAEGTETPVPATAEVAPAPLAEAPAPEPEPEAVELPEGFVAVPKIEREMVMPFKVMDADGELEVPDMMIEFKANGKTRKEPLDKVVQLASFGVYNHEREQQVQASKAEVQQTQAQMQRVVDYALLLEQEREAMLSNDDLYLTKRAQYEQQNTPEARLQRDREQLATDQRHQAFSQAAQAGEQFYSTKLVPAVETIIKALPTISAEEIGAKLLLIADRYKVHTPDGSIIDPRAHRLIEQAIVNEVVPWAQQVHDSRDADRRSSAKQTDTEKQTLKKAAESAQVESQKSKSLVTKMAKPGQGRAGKDTPTPKPIKTVEDAENAALADTMAAMGFSRAS